MTRNRASAKAAGTRFESLIAACLAQHLHPAVERLAKCGAKDRGDIAGVTAHGCRVVIEAKDYGGRLEVGPWLTEARVERDNDGAIAGLVVAKRRGTTDPLDQTVICTVRDLIALLTGETP
jgi:hypothetical protein